MTEEKEIKKIPIGGFYTRGISAIVLGLVFMIWPGSSIDYIMRILGIVLLIIGVITLTNYLRIKKHHTGLQYNQRVTPYMAALMLAVSLLLLIFPRVFVNFIMIIMGVLLLIAALELFATISWRRKFGIIPRFFYIFPLVLVISGVLVITQPFATATGVWVLCGAALVFYGIVELLSSSRI
ncbi:MAG: DUF308 domain-containing protein [Rikenellaceae bacterium]|nr:DUF308 domain-containing protein [Rikenellaceae bacterium]